MEQERPAEAGGCGSSNMNGVFTPGSPLLKYTSTHGVLADRVSPRSAHGEGARRQLASPSVGSWRGNGSQRCGLLRRQRHTVNLLRSSKSTTRGCASASQPSNRAGRDRSRLHGKAGRKLCRHLPPRRLLSGWRSHPLPVSKHRLSRPDSRSSVDSRWNRPNKNRDFSRSGDAGLCRWCHTETCRAWYLWMPGDTTP